MRPLGRVLGIVALIVAMLVILFLGTLAVGYVLNDVLGSTDNTPSHEHY